MGKEKLLIYQVSSFFILSFKRLFDCPLFLFYDKSKPIKSLFE